MKNHNRDLLVLLKARKGETNLEATLEGLHQMLRQAESLTVFCAVHEIARRNRISRKRMDILRAIEFAELKPFHFLINKN